MNARRELPFVQAMGSIAPPSTSASSFAPPACTSSTPPPPRVSKGGVALVATWLVVAACALGALAFYKSSAGVRGEPPRSWPTASALEHAPAKPTLVLFAHPRCVCTRASLTQLREVVSTYGEKVDVEVVFLRPGSTSDDWSKTDTWRDAKSMQGVRVVVDVDGQEAARFGVQTSGHVVLYGGDGELLFSGGITVARGHAGRGPAFDRLMRRLEAATSPSNGAPAEHGTSLVYGCSLTEEP